MKNKSILFLFIIGILSLPVISATCTVTFDKETYSPTEIVTAQMSCTEANEKSDEYTLNWTYENGTQLELDTSTTPSTIGEFFYEEYTLASSWPIGTYINATLIGTDLDGATDYANVTDAGANSLLITNTSFAGGYLGLVSSIKGIVKDENGKKISGGLCKISGWSNDETRALLIKDTVMIDGEIKESDILPVSRFDEGTDYAYKILCYCGSSGSGTECIDEDGVGITNSMGTTKNAFSTNTWLTVNTVADKSDYTMKDDLTICANLTNVDYPSRIPVEISHQVRCSSQIDNDDDTDRNLILSDQGAHDERGISSGTTQMQCKKFVIPEIDYLQGKSNQCYASTNVVVLDNSYNKITSYHTTSAVFNITSTELNLNPDWKRISDKILNSIINLSSFADINGSGTGDIDIRLHRDIEGLDLRHAFDLINQIKNITVKNTTSTLIENTDYEIEHLEDGNIEIEIRNVPLTKTGSEWYNITLEFYDLNLREVEALEGIETKTGTFHLDVDCPAVVEAGSNMRCTINAKIEDSQTVQKEVDFTCYISDNENTHSSQNFNQMVTQELTSINSNFLVPSSLDTGRQYVLQCHADYYNLGSRRDSFYDTFLVTGGPGGGDGKSIFGPTGGAIDEEDGEGFGPFPPIPKPSKKMMWATFIIFMIIIIVKALNIQVGIVLGEDKFGNLHKGDRKITRLQNRLNRIALRNELKYEKRKKSIRVLRLKKWHHLHT